MSDAASSRLRALLFWTLVPCALVLLAAWLARPVHELTMDLGFLKADAGHADKGFLRVFRRLLLVPPLVLLLVELRPWKGRHLARFGLVGPAARARPALWAYGLTLVAVCVLLALHFAGGWLRWESAPDWGAFGRRLGRRFGSGLLVGALEEWFFRGWLLAVLVRRTSLRRAALLSALVFALLHAFQPGTLGMAVHHDTLGALGALRTWLGHMVDPVAFGPAFLGLFLLALLLTGAYVRTGTLWTPVAIHAAGVCILYSYGGITERSPGRTWAGTWHLYDGPPGWVLLGLTAWWLWPRGAASPDPGAGSRPA